MDPTFFTLIGFAFPSTTVDPYFTLTGFQWAIEEVIISGGKVCATTSLYASINAEATVFTPIEADMAVEVAIQAEASLVGCDCD